MKITSVDNPKIKEYVKLHNNKEQRNRKQFIVETRNLVEEAIKAGVAETVITTRADYQFDNVVHVSDNVMKKLSVLSTPSDFLAICHIKEATFDYDSNYLILDYVQDPGNVGTILRTALAFDIKNIITSTNSAHLYHNKVIQSSQGAIFYLNIKSADLVGEVDDLKQHGYTIVGTAFKDATVLSPSDHYDKYVLILGNEGQGMTQEIIDLCDELKYIQIRNIDSLNVAISAGIMMYQLQQH